MSNRTGLCWHCIKRDKCSMFKKDTDKITINCGRFKVNSEDQKFFKEILDKFINRRLLK